MEIVILKHKGQIACVKKASGKVAATHRKLKEYIDVGVRTSVLDTIAADFIRSQDASPAFLGYRSYPFSICTSINEEVIHGFPSDRRLKDGDLLSIDVGVQYKGYCGDAAFSVQVGRQTKKGKAIIDTVHGALIEGIQQARHGKKVGDISYAVQSYTEGGGFNVVRDYCGHGIGRELHEEPMIPNFGYSNRGFKLKAGMIICIEPMITEGSEKTEVGMNEWTVRTIDRKLSAHYEHTVLITDGMPVILSN
jgi:methionyl aminopeptidase